MSTWFRLPREFGPRLRETAVAQMLAEQQEPDRVRPLVGLMLAELDRLLKRPAAG